MAFEVAATPLHAAATGAGVFVAQLVTAQFVVGVLADLGVTLATKGEAAVEALIGLIVQAFTGANAVGRRFAGPLAARQETASSQRHNDSSNNEEWAHGVHGVHGSGVVPRRLTLVNAGRPG